MLHVDKMTEDPSHVSHSGHTKANNTKSGQALADDSTSSTNLGCSGYGIWFLWLLLNITGMGIGWALGWQLSFAVPGIFATWAIGVVSGIILALFQWLLLRIVMHMSPVWIFLSALGWAIGFFLGASVASFWGLTQFAFGGIAGAVLGLFVGIAQWWLLRDKLNASGWWILVNVIAWGASLVVYLPGFNVTGVLYGAVSGGITGLALVGLRFNIFQTSST